MSMIKDSIKISLSRQGYLPDYPYHLISDVEMCNAFIDTTHCTLDIGDDELPIENKVLWTGERLLDKYFDDNYPCLDELLVSKYQALVDAICYNILLLENSNDPNYELPSWIYSYMLGQVVSINSDKRDIHDLLVMLNIDNMEDDFLAVAEQACYRVSSEWVGKYITDKRPPTLFGEPHVIKSLRLSE